MPGSKIAIMLALALASATPALAGMNGTESINRISSAQSSAPAMQVRPDWQSAWASAARPQPASEAISRSYPHRYYGGPKSIH